MNKKNQRREAAQKRAKRQKITLMAVCAVLAVGFAVGLIMYQITRPAARVFSVPGQSVTLYEDGRFTARLAHNHNLSGTFIEEVSGNVSAISFFTGGNTVSTQIEDDVLILPPQWRSNCRAHVHETEFPLQR